MGKKKRARTVMSSYEEPEEKGFEYLQGTLRPGWWNKMDRHQTKLVSALNHHLMVMIDAKAGTGKTTIVICEALRALKEGRVDRIQYVRFPDERSMKLGALPGNDQEKGRGYFNPFFEAMAECGVQEEGVYLLIAHGTIELATDIHMRGRNMKRTYLIVDEAQNGHLSDLKLILTRPHDSGMNAVIGHSGQVDSKVRLYGRKRLNPFQVYQLHMDLKPWTKLCELQHDYRGDVSRHADKVMETVKWLERDIESTEVAH